jgi:hypothetical protein
MPAMKRLLTPLLSILLVLAFALASGCATEPKAPKQDALIAYAAAVRWSDFDTALTLIDPASRPTPELAEEERDRLAKFKVSGYEVKSQAMTPDGILQQTVEIRVIDQDTQKERVLLDHQRWRSDATGEVWVLLSGLPEF